MQTAFIQNVHVQLVHVSRVNLSSEISQMDHFGLLVYINVFFPGQ